MALPKIRKQIQNRVLKTGDTFSGDVFTGTGYGAINTSSTNLLLGSLNAQNNFQNGRFLELHNSNNTSAPELNKAISLTSVENGAWKAYQLYGEHNKPTAADVGALSLNGGVVTGDVTFKGFAHFHGDIGGPEGGQISFNKPETDTSFGSGLTVDVYKNSFRFFADHNGALKIFDFDFSSHPGGNSVILHSGNTIKYPSRQSLTIPEIYDGTTIRKDLKAFMETNANLHKATAEYSGEFNLYRFFAALDESNYASYNLPCVDSHVLTFSIDSTTNWIRLLALDMRTSDIYTISKTSSSWGTWKKLLDSGNFTSYALPANVGFNNNAAKCVFKSSNATLNASGSVTDLEIQSAENRKAACITFHIPNQYALHFGIDENTSRLSVGGWSMGAASYDIYTRHYPQVSVTSGAPAAGVGNERIWAW